ncbi:Disease resistance protein RPM1 [Dichanthelium oligosanthes]|uniref:non-specific serine/threonine protein kinase n=1 Tax=Dichanthelium oligosanthes TaxID=888268 RepID=A0A1E5W3S8_9POAL|nr:Disease resistance protein RPM1 [Dichanthelium oligosanthes]
MKGDSSRQSSSNDNSQISSSFPREPKLEFLKHITQDFSSEREGILQNGQVVAVKKLVQTSGVHDRRFQNEAANLQILEHGNIVKLLGSCYQVDRKLVERNGRHVLSDVPEKFLCYEYLSNGSLDSYIYDESSGLDWTMRFKIISGICNGLCFLHEERNEAIVHLNLKPSNIMLGDNMVPKITDFGLSRLFGEEQTRILTQNVVGWIGEISVKSDIFSLGVLILEIVTGLKKDLNTQDISSKLFIDYVSKNWTKRSHVESKYPSLEEQHLLQINRCIELGLNCVETDPKKRPTAGSIIGKLKEINPETSIHKFMEKKLQLKTEFPREPKLHFVEEITGNFSNEREIGRGSFGIVYKGALQSGEVVAVKRLLEVSQTNQDNQFKNEVSKSWTKMPQIASKYPTLEEKCLQQVKRCIDIGLKTELMAEALLTALSKIGTVLGDEVIKFVVAEASKKVTNLKELPENIRHIRRELNMINSVVKDLDTTNVSSNVVEQWTAELRTVAFHVEDVMDKYSYHAFKVQEEGSLNKWFFKGANNAKVFSDIADEVVRIKNEINGVHELRREYFPALQHVPSSSAAIDRRDRQGSLPELFRDVDLVGITSNQAKMIGWLHCNEPNSTVITVSGMGGLGKTTLVMNVYESEKIKFPVHVWITVSQTYTIDGLLRDLLRKIEYKDSMEKMDVHDLTEKLKNLLGTTKCLVVLDDVWNKEVYRQMEGIFNSLQASRIIITTRRYDVASLASSKRHLQIQPLGSSDAFNLFCRRAFHNTADQMCPPELEDVATSIVDRCKGLPLAIISMGSLMSSKKPIKHTWNQVYNQFRSELAKPDNVQAILKLSYNDLPGNLRNCFLYCSLFPEDYIMSRESLVRQWVAEGFVVTNENNEQEDVAELNLMELITRNMLQVKDYDELGRVDTCKMHDIVRDLALSIAKDERFGSANDQRAVMHMNQEVRRLSLCGWNDSDVPTVRFPHLRTLFSLDGVTSTPHMLASIFSKSSYLTVLELQDSEITEVPGSIGYLFNLRYIGLRRTRVKSLPECIEKLSNLQTLDIKQTNIEKLPRGIVKIKNLRHLLADRVVDEKQKNFQYFAGVQAPKDLSNLVELQTLETVEATDELAGQLERLRKLQSVWIGKVSAMHSAKLFATLSKLPLLSSLLLNAIDENQTLHLEALNPQSKQLHKLIIRGHLAAGTLQCPIFHGHGENLRYLALSWSGLQGDPLRLLAEHVPNLTYLSLNRVSDANTLVIPEGCFPQLKTLVLKNLYNVNLLMIGKGALKNIEGTSKLSGTERECTRRCHMFWSFASKSNHLIFNNIPALPQNNVMDQVLVNSASSYQFPNVFMLFIPFHTSHQESTCMYLHAMLFQLLHSSVPPTRTKLCVIELHLKTRLYTYASPCTK